MQELLPVLIGMLVGFVRLPVRSFRLRGPVALVMTLLGGAVAATINGEWTDGIVSWLADVALVAAGALAVLTSWTVVRYPSHWWASTSAIAPRS
jgi:hypothetical protein